MALQELWFGVIAALFLGFFILEGFDFGVGMLMEPFARLSRSGDADPETQRRTALNTIGPVWDGNEVWLITAGAGMFAAFPGWYATVFSTLYLPLLAILFGMIVRAVAIEWRGKIDDTKWRALADFGIAAGSWLPAVLWGVAFAVHRWTPMVTSIFRSAMCSTPTRCWAAWPRPGCFCSTARCSSR
jgi:cytochrome d ubiquinol oxidase subunit II